MNFKIIEGDYTEWELYPLFCEYYNDLSMSIAEIKEKLGITNNQYLRFRKHGKNKGDIKIRHKSSKHIDGRFKRTEHNIYPFRNQYYIKKRIKGKQEYYGSFSSLNDAIKVKNELIKLGWEHGHVDEICERINVKRGTSKNSKKGVL